MEDLDPKSVLLIHFSEEIKITHKVIYRFAHLHSTYFVRMIEETRDYLHN